MLSMLRWIQEHDAASALLIRLRKTLLEQLERRNGAHIFQVGRQMFERRRHIARPTLRTPFVELEGAPTCPNSGRLPCG